jgi:hypothetical protein
MAVKHIDKFAASKYEEAYTLIISKTSCFSKFYTAIYTCYLYPFDQIQGWQL